MDELNIQVESDCFGQFSGVLMISVHLLAEVETFPSSHREFRNVTPLLIRALADAPVSAPLIR